MRNVSNTVMKTDKDFIIIMIIIHHHHHHACTAAPLSSAVPVRLLHAGRECRRSYSQLRSARRHHVVVPRYNRSMYGRRAFSVAGPMTWNSLTDCLRDPSLSIDSFCRQLKKFLL